MDNLIIVGAGSYGREAYSIAKSCLGYGENFIIKGFLDKNDTVWSHNKSYPKILGSTESYDIQEKDTFIIAISDIETKMRCVKTLSEKGAKFTNLIHKGCIFGDHVELGTGIFLGYDVIISNDCILQDHITINSRTVIGHDCTIGDFASIGANVFIGGNVTIGSRCSLHSASNVMRGLNINENSTVGIGSTVLRNVPSNRTVFGSPAKIVY